MGEYEITAIFKLSRNLLNQLRCIVYQKIEYKKLKRKAILQFPGTRFNRRPFDLPDNKSSLRIEILAGFIKAMSFPRIPSGKDAVARGDSTWSEKINRRSMKGS